MEKLAIGFWGCFFGTATFILVGSALAFTHSMRRISINAALAALGSAFYVAAFVGVFPIADPDTLARFLAHVAVLVSGVLAYLLVVIFEVFKRWRDQRRRVMQSLCGMGFVTLAAGWALSPSQALVLGVLMAGLLGTAALLICLRNALHDHRLAWAAMVSMAWMVLAVIGMGWVALDRTHAPLWVHAVSAISSTGYLVALAYVMWARYAYLFELNEVMTFGPGYDPITRMRSHAETGNMVGEVFKRFREEPAPLGVIVLTIANLYGLEKLHGVAAANSALFVCAGRLRQSVPAHIEMGRLGSDGFVLIMRNFGESGRLIDVARGVESRLRKSFSLNTSGDVAQFETERTVWMAEVGVGVMVVSNPAMRGSNAIAMARSVSRTAMSYASRIAWFDQSSGGIVELSTRPPN